MAARAVWQRGGGNPRRHVLAAGRAGGALPAGLLEACCSCPAADSSLPPAPAPFSTALLLAAAMQAADTAWTNWLRARAASGASWDELQVRSEGSKDVRKAVLNAIGR